MDIGFPEQLHSLDTKPEHSKKMLAQPSVIAHKIKNAKALCEGGVQAQYESVSEKSVQPMSLYLYKNNPGKSWNSF